MKRVTLLVSVWLLAAVCLWILGIHAQVPANNNVISDLERPLQACEQQVAGWRREEHTQIVLVICIMISGAVISGVQKGKSSPATDGSGGGWIKWTTVVLGIATTVMTALTGLDSRVFTADYRTLRQAAFEGEHFISTMAVITEQLKDTSLSPQDRIAVTGEYLSMLEKFHAVGEKMYGKPVSASTSAASGTDVGDSSFHFLPIVHAQAQAGPPAWVKSPPSDNTSLYFVGQAADASLATARQNSLDDAYRNAVAPLKRLAPTAADADLLRIMKASAVLQNSTFTYDRATGRYICYTLLRVSREIQGIGLRALQRP